MISLGKIKLPRISKSLFGLLIVLLISLPTVWNLFRPGLYKMHDDLQVVRVYEMTKCIYDGQIPCRWVPDMGYRFGYPQYNYYGPLPYYLMSAVNILGVNLFDSAKLGFVLSLILGNIAIYYLAKELFGFESGILTAILYAYTPYRGSDIFSRGAMSEAWAFVFIPLILLFVKRLIDNQNIKNCIYLSLSVACLLTTHNISSLIFAPMAIFYALVLLMFKYKFNLLNALKKSGWLFMSGLWGVGISAFFTLPVIFEKGIAHTESMIGGYFDYRAHFVTIKQLFFTSFWGVGSSEIGPADDLSFFISPVVLSLIIVVSILVFKRLFTKKAQLPEFLVVTFVFLGLTSAFMTHEKSSAVWSLLTPLIYLQFPWRFLVTTNIFLILSVGYLFYNVSKNIKYKTGLVVIFIVTFLLSVSFFRPSEWFSYTEKEKFSGMLWDKQMTISIFDYLPTSALVPPNHPAPILPSSSEKVSFIENFSKGTNWLKFNYTSSKDSVVWLNVLNFPNWRVIDNGKLIPHTSGSDGIVSINLPAGSHQIYAKLHNSLVRTIGNTLSLGLFFLAIYLLVVKKQHVSKS